MNYIMTREYETAFMLYGEQADIKKMIDVIVCYQQHGERGAYFSYPITMVNGKSVLFERRDLESDIYELIAPFLASGKVGITLSGPWGEYYKLNDIDLFREMAEVAPNAGFVARISGVEDYCIQRLDCELKDRKLNIKTLCQ